MRTTIDIPDALGKQIKSRAALSGQSLKCFISRALERQLAAGVSQETDRKAASLPVLRSGKPASMNMTPDEISALLIREEVEAYAADVRR